MRARWASLALLAAVAGCGTRAASAPPLLVPTRATTPAVAASVAPTPAAALSGDEAFLYEARSLDMGIKDFSAATDAQALDVGRKTCRVFDTQKPPAPADRRLGFETIVQALMLQTQAPEASVRDLITAAVVNLCPWNRDVLPPT